MEQTTESGFDYKKQSVLYGAIYGVTFSLILYSSLIVKLNQYLLLLLGIIGLIVSVFTVYMPIKKFKNNNDGTLNLSQSIKIGLSVGLIGGLIYAFITYLSSGFSDFDMATRNLIVMISKSFIIALVIGLIKKT